MRQQQQIEHNQQLLIAKEKRLKYLRQDELKRQQQISLQKNIEEQNRFKSHNGGGSTFLTSPLQQHNSNNKENVVNNQFSQELKLIKLNQLSNQIIEQKTSNSNMYSELDLIKLLFVDKERELYDAISKVSELTKQIDQLRKLKASNNTQHQQQHQQFSNANELEKLKQELHIRNKLNEQQAKKIMEQHELFQQKQLEVMALDKRIEELQSRIASKRVLNQQIQNQFMQQHHNNNQKQQSPSLSTQTTHLTIEPSIQQNQQQQNISPNSNQFEDECDTNMRQRHQQKLQKIVSNSPIPFDNHSVSPSPSKNAPKFATKQEIANTYMNKFGMEAYQKYQEASKRLSQQQQQILQMKNQPSPQQQESNFHVKQVSIDSNDSSSNASTGNNSVSPTAAQNTADGGSQQEQSSLPSHLKLEFDKIKFIPDMVKTIKKRHSISDIEGSSHTVPPQLFQKMLEQHHKNSQLNRQQQQQPQFHSLPTQLSTFQQTTQESTQEQAKQQLRPIKESDECKKETESPAATHETQLAKKKSIIKLPRPSSQSSQKSRRVNFDPHALLLDAAVEGEIELVIKCSTQVKSISEPNDEGITALHNSVCAGHFDIVKHLVEFGCDINYADNDGWTSLHCAASCNNLQMVKFLIEHGASLFATTISDNETAVDKCEEDEDGFAGCSEFLLQMEDKLGTANDGVVYALYDYEAENEDELSFKCSDQLKILGKTNEYDDEGWWLAETNDNKRGLVARNYIGVSIRHFGF